MPVLVVRISGCWAASHAQDIDTDKYYRPTTRTTTAAAAAVVAKEAEEEEDDHCVISCRVPLGGQRIVY